MVSFPQIDTPFNQHLPPPAGLPVGCNADTIKICAHNRTNLVFNSQIQRLDLGNMAVRYTVAHELFTKGVAACALAAFLSLFSQYEGLHGVNGLLPAERFMRGVQDKYHDRAAAVAPSLLWHHADLGLTVDTWAQVLAVGTLMSCHGKPVWNWRLLRVFGLMGVVCSFP